MKKLISILLVAMLIIGMFPATVLTAFAADAETFTYDFSTFSGSSTQYAAETHTLSSDVTLAIEGCHINTQLRVYGSKSTEYAIFKADNKPISAITVNAGYKADTLNVYGSNDNGATWAELASLTTTTAYNELPATFTEQYKWVKLEVKESGQVRIKTVTLTLNPAATEPDEPENPDVPECEHTNTTAIGEAKEATCTETGITAGVKCADCGETITAQETIPAKGHNYVDGVCDREGCGAEEPEGYVLTDIADIKATDKVIITATKSGKVYAMSNDKGTSSGPVPVEVKVSDGIIAEAADNILWNVGGSADAYIFYPNGTTATWLYCTSTNNGVRVGTNTANTFKIDADSGYLKHNGTGRYLGVYNTQDWRCYTTSTTNIADQTFAFYVLSVGSEDPDAPVCEHTNTAPVGDAKEATCTETGITAGEKCADCGKVLEAQKVIDAKGHSYVDGACSVCQTPDPFVNLPGRYYIAATRSSGNYWYMTSDLGTGNTKRYQAVDSGLTELPTEITNPEDGYVFVISRNEDGTFCIQAEGVEGDNYLGGKADNVGLLVGADGDNNKFTADANDDGTYSFHFTASDSERYLSLNGTSGSDFFAWYKGTQKQNLTLIPVVEGEAEPVAKANGQEYPSVEAAYAADPTATIQLLANVADVTVDGELYLDLNGFNATVNATKIYACDSSATVAKAGTGSLTTTSEVVIDNTVDGTRYIALKGEDGAYTFHVLELQLTTVSLRTSAAGIYYKAVMNCDEVLKAAIDCHGMVVSVENMPGADFATEEGNNGWTRIVGAPAEGNMTSCSVFGIFKAGAENAERGVMKIYANAYLKLTTGETIMADTTVGDKAKGEEGGNENFDGVAWSLKDVMVELNSKFSALDAADQENVIKFYEAWSSVMSAWELTNIATAATPVA